MPLADADFEQMNKGCDEVLEKLKNQEDQYNHVMAEVKQKMNKDRNFKGDADKYLPSHPATSRSRMTKSTPRTRVWSPSTTSSRKA